MNRRTLILLLLITLTSISVRAIELAPPVILNDSTTIGTTNAKYTPTTTYQQRLEAKYGKFTPLREIEYSSIPLLTFGIIAHSTKKDCRSARNHLIPSYNNRLDDVLQHVPLMGTFAMRLSGYEGRSSWTRFLTSGIMSYGFMALFTNAIKYSVKEMRPDGTTNNSFPSGHTATAFVAATIMHKEYGMTRSPWWSVAGYTCATTTGIMRTLNNRHWISDVLVGAGVGIISTDLGYMMGDLLFKKKGIVRENRQGNNDLTLNHSFFRFQLGMQFIGNIDFPTNIEFFTTARLWNTTGATTWQDDYYLVKRFGNPFRIPDDFDAKEQTFYKYVNSTPGFSENQIPELKVVTGTSVSAEAAYFINKYIGIGARGRITTAPVSINGLYSYVQQDGKEGLTRLNSSSSVSDVWAMVDADAGLYFAHTFNARHRIDMKALYGRKFFGKIDLVSTYYSDNPALQNKTIYGDELDIKSTHADTFTLGFNYTFSMGSGATITAFCDYDYCMPTFDVEYTPYNSSVTDLLCTHSEFSFDKRMHFFTIGAALGIMF